jgi:hypothetical protein
MTVQEFYAMMQRREDCPRYYYPIGTFFTTLSIQGSSLHYCTPGEDNLAEYTHYEIWCDDDLPGLRKWRDFDIVQLYVQVPVEEIVKELNTHGTIRVQYDDPENTH